MCQFCVKHGEGEKWYLRGENYSRELEERSGGVKAIADFARGIGSSIRRGKTIASLVNRLPWFLPEMVRRAAGWHQEKTHFGQVVPLEDVEAILDRMASVVRLPCLCRRHMGGGEGRYCLGISIRPSTDERDRIISEAFSEGPDVSGLEYLTRQEASELVRQFDREGLVHTVWTLGTPFIVSICNCQPETCGGLYFQSRGFHLLFRAEYAAVVNESCTGCGACVEQCPFGAIELNREAGSAFIDPVKCYGCGVCRQVCPGGAIEMVDRKSHSTACNIW